MPLNNPKTISDAAREQGDNAAWTLMVDALRGIKENLDAIAVDHKQTAIDLSTLRIDVALLKDRDGRVAKLETDLAALRLMLTGLQTDKDRRDGALSAGSWLAANWQGMVFLLGAAWVAFKAGWVR